MSILDDFATEVEAAQAHVPSPHDMELLSSLQLDHLAYWVRELRRERDALTTTLEEYRVSHEAYRASSADRLAREEAEREHYERERAADRKTVADLRALLRRWQSDEMDWELRADTTKALEAKP